MSEVTKEDIAGVHTRIDSMITVQTATQVSVAVIEQRLNDLKIPPSPVRPCPFFNEHITDHKKIKGIWHNSAIKTAIDIVKLAIVAGITWLFATHDRS